MPNDNQSNSTLSQNHTTDTAIPVSNQTTNQNTSSPISPSSTQGQPNTSSFPENNAQLTYEVTAQHAPQKYGGKKAIATMFGLLLLFGGVAAGVILVQRQQDISENAQTSTYTATCSAVKAYDESWNELNLEQLSNLTPRSPVRFSVSGTSSAGSFDKARFSVNGGTSQEVTTKKPGSEEFYYEYTIPEHVTNFQVKGEIHHTVWGWF